ncbi:hypothetical protein M0R45_029887 [Rubus argutus]|uniref:Uncharacterized protein n=1 Tax=Rubus argutus TaxID=59490 RepID=A0AAW1W9K2_RUBAR
MAETASWCSRRRGQWALRRGLGRLVRQGRGAATRDSGGFADSRLGFTRKRGRSDGKGGCRSMEAELRARRSRGARFHGLRRQRRDGELGSLRRRQWQGRRR